MIQNPIALANRLLEELVALRADLAARPAPPAGVAPDAAAPSAPMVPPALAEALLRLEHGAPMTTEQVMLALACSKRHLERLIKRSQAAGVALPRWRQGGRAWRWDGGAVKDWAVAVGTSQGEEDAG